eukprot:506730-Prorocentrum_minimum.AAC.3
MHDFQRLVTHAVRIQRVVRRHLARRRAAGLSAEGEGEGGDAPIGFEWWADTHVWISRTPAEGFLESAPQVGNRRENRTDVRIEQTR